MRWNEIILSDNTSLNVTSIAFGNGYYTALSVRLVSDEYHIDILYTDNLANEWTTKTVYNSGADPVFAPGIVFTGSKFVIPFTTNLSNSLSAISFTSPADAPTITADIFSYTHPMHVNSVRYVGGKVIVCGTKQETDDADAISGYIWYCTDPTGVWEAYPVLEYSATASTAGNAQAAIYDSTDTKYKVYAVAKQDGATNSHRIYTSNDLTTWEAPTIVATDTLSALPYPAFAYCAEYDAVALFLHGQIYVSKAGQPFVSLPYPANVGAESIRAVTSDGTKFLASSASDNQADLKVLYSSGDPTVAANWRVQTLAQGTQISSDVKFIDDTDLFIVVAGYGNDVKPTIYTALFAANEFNIMKDRVPTYPGRVSLTPLGNNLYTLARADDPTEEGTKLSKVNLLSDDAALAVWNNTPPDILCTPSTALEHLGNNAFHVGDILTTARDLSTDENWLKCDGSEIDAAKYPELANLFGGAVIPSEWEPTVSAGQSVTNGSIRGIQALANKVFLFESYYDQSTNTRVIVRISTDSGPLQKSTEYYAGTSDGDYLATDGTTIVLFSIYWIDHNFRPRPRSASFWYGSTSSFSQAVLPVPNYRPSQYSEQDDVISNGDLSYGNGYWLACGYTQGGGGQAALIWYGTSPSSMTYTIMSQTSSSIDTLDYVISVAAGNNLFACIQLDYTGTRNPKVGYSNSPGSTYTFLSSNYFSNYITRLRFFKDIWVAYAPGQQTIWTKRDLTNNNEPWQSISPPPTYVGATIDSINYADGNFILVGKRDNKSYSWTCISLDDAWHEVVIGADGKVNVPFCPVYDNANWWLFGQGSAEGAYLYKKTNNTPPNVPLIPDDGKVRAYIKAKEGD